MKIDINPFERDLIKVVLITSIAKLEAEMQSFPESTGDAFQSAIDARNELLARFDMLHV